MKNKVSLKKQGDRARDSNAMKATALQAVNLGSSTGTTYGFLHLTKTNP